MGLNLMKNLFKKKVKKPIDLEDLDLDDFEDEFFITR